MAYSKRIPPIKLVLSSKEFNNLVGVLTENLKEENDDEIKEFANLTKEKLLKYSVPREVDNNIEVDLRLYANEVADIISQLLAYLNKRIVEIDYYQVLLKVRESNVENNEIKM